MKLSKKNLIDKLVCITYPTTSGAEEVYGKIYDFKKGYGLIDIRIFPVHDMDRPQQREHFKPGCVLDRLIEGTFLIQEFPTYKSMLKQIKKLNP